MSWATCIVDQLKAYQVHFISYVPDAMGEQILMRARQNDFFGILPLAREEEGIGVATGQYMGGQTAEGRAQNFYIGLGFKPE